MDTFAAIPTDPEQISQEIDELLEVTPASSERGRLFWLIKSALNGLNEGGGAGLPLSVPSTDALKTFSSLRDDLTPNEGYFSYPVPNARFSVTDDSIGSVDPFNAKVAEGVPMMYGDSMVGVQTLQYMNGNLVFNASLSGATGRVIAQGRIPEPANNPEYFIADGCSLVANNGDFYAAYASKKTNSKVSFQMLMADQSGELKLLGTELELSLSLGTGSNSRLEGAVQMIEGGAYMVVHLSSRQSSSLRRTIATINTTTFAVTYAVEDESVFDDYYPLIRVIDSHSANNNYVVVNLAMTDTDDSTFEIYRYNRGVGSMTKIGMSSVVKGGGNRPQLIGLAISPSSNKAIIHHGADYSNTNSIDVCMLNTDTDTDAISKVSYNLSRFDNTHFTECPSFLSISAMSLPDGLVIGLQRKNSDQMDLIHPDTLKVWSTITTWYCDAGARFTSGVEEMLPIAVDVAGSNYLRSRDARITDFKAMIFDAYPTHVISNLKQTDLTSPTSTQSTNENYLVTGAFDVNEIAEVLPPFGGGGYDAIMLPNVPTVVNIACTGIVVIPEDAPDGTEYLINYVKKGLGHTSLYRAYYDFNPIIAIRANPDADTWATSICCPKGNPNAEGDVVASVFVRKVSEGVFDYKQM